MEKKKYRVNDSEHFNLMSMYDKLKSFEIDMMESPKDYTKEQREDLEDRLLEVEELLEKAPCIGASVDWPTLKRIREIKEERQMLRYTTCLAQGISEKEAATAFNL